MTPQESVVIQHGDVAGLYAVVLCQEARHVSGWDPFTATRCGPLPSGLELAHNRLVPPGDARRTAFPWRSEPLRQRRLLGIGDHEHPRERGVAD